MLNEEERRRTSRNVYQGIKVFIYAVLHFKIKPGTGHGSQKHPLTKQTQTTHHMITPPPKTYLSTASLTSLLLFVHCSLINILNEVFFFIF